MGKAVISMGLRIILLASATGCSPDLPDPTLLSVSPSEWYSGLDVELSILGEDLYPAVQVTGGEVDIDREYRAWLESSLGSVELEGVSLRSYSELGGWVRAGLEPGRYDLRVRSPAGVDVLLPEAFRATDTAIQGIGIDFQGTYSPRVGETVAFSIYLEGWDGEQVHQPLEIEVVAERDDGDPLEVEFHPSTLVDQRTLSDEVGIRGSLDEDGEALILFTSTTPGSLELEVRPVLEDSSIDTARLDLYFEAGAVDALDVSLSTDSRSFVAGDVLSIDLTLLDELENPTQVDEPLTVHLQELCAGEIDNDQYTSLLDTRTVSFEIHGATSESCPENQLIARIAQEKGSLEGTSETFVVAAGTPDAFGVNTFAGSVVAGEDLVPLLISVRDQFDNLITDYSETLTFTDAEGAPLVASCSDFSAGLAVCEVALYDAGQVVITITNPDGSLSGSSSLITVSAGEPSRVSLSTGTGVSTADDGRDFILRVTDDYDNDIIVPPAGVAGAPVFSIGGSTVSCAANGSDADGYRYHCALTDAAEDRELTVSVLGLAALSSRFDVVNGVLTEMLFSGPGNARAGQSVTVYLAGYDAWGNPFTEVGSGSLDVELYDDSGDVSERVTLNSSGQATLSSLSLTTVWEDNHLHAAQSGRWLGSSATFSITAADMDHFLVEPERAFGWVDEPLSISISAVDPYDNLIETYSGTVSLSSATGLGSTVSTASFSDGVATVDFTPTSAGYSDALSASDGTFSGTSSRLDALDADCDDPPIASLTIDGDTTGLACRNSGTTAAVLLSATASDPGGGTLTTWYFYTEPTGWQRATTESMSQVWTAEGAWAVSVVTGTDSACADQTSSVIYVADDDGEPAGPVTLSPASSALVADTSSSSGQTSVDVYAMTCTGADAAGGTLLVRTDLGALSGSGLTSSGSGLELLLDGSGEGTITWSVGGQLFGAEGSLYAGRADGAAAGTAAVSVSGDGHLPTVIGVSPAGTRSDTISTLEVRFSEPMQENTINDSTVRILDPDGLAVDILDHELSDSEEGPDGALTDSVLELTLASSVNLSEGVWTLWLSSTLSDLDGNGLNGAFTGSVAPFALQLGLVSDDAPDLSACSLSLDTFRPDGDDGSGSEADEVTLSLSATDPATWWLLEVFSSDGTLVQTEILAAGSSSGQLTWDGRGWDGLIVDNGDYLLRAEPLDAAWNTGAACSATAAVDNSLP